MVILDQTWRVQTALALAAMSTVGKELRGYPSPVPKAAEPLDNTLKSIGTDLVYIADEYTAGVDNMNTGRLNNAARRMQGVGEKAGSAIRQVQALAAS
jgi:hypothetical protein